ncbi:hypothetical protein ACQ3G6_16965 [Allorhizobium undicola]|uniref:hypothetical protein n=1 Tax=Allorhizobium undicola TaxID=78527 RepID=UPI003D34D8CA
MTRLRHLSQERLLSLLLPLLCVATLTVAIETHRLCDFFCVHEALSAETPMPVDICSSSTMRTR